MLHAHPIWRKKHFLNFSLGVGTHAAPSFKMHVDLFLYPDSPRMPHIPSLTAPVNYPPWRVSADFSVSELDSTKENTWLCLRGDWCRWRTCLVFLGFHHHFICFPPMNIWEKCPAGCWFIRKIISPHWLDESDSKIVW